MDAATIGAVQATSAQSALAQRLAHWRTQDPSSSHGPTDSTQVASHVSPCCTNLKYAFCILVTILGAERGSYVHIATKHW